MENTIYHFMLGLKNNSVFSLICLFLGIRRVSLRDSAEHLGENIPLNIIDEIAKNA